MLTSGVWILFPAIGSMLVVAFAIRSAGHARAHREARKLIRALGGPRG